MRESTRETAARIGPRSVTGRRGSESGETLVEILISVAVLGIISTAIIFGLLTTIWGSTTYRSAATLDTVLRTAAQQATSQIQQSASNPVPAQSAFYCPPPSQASLVTFNLPSGYSASLSDPPGYWNTSTSTAQPGCIANSALVETVKVVGPKGGFGSLDFVVADPATATDPQCSPACTATKLALIYQPGSPQMAGSVFTPAPAVAVEDSSGRIVTTDLSGASLAIYASATDQQVASNCQGVEYEGLITFSGCLLNTAGRYYVTITDASLPAAGQTVTTKNNPFLVNPGPPSQLLWSQSPGGSITGGLPFPVQPWVVIQDAYGNPETGETSGTSSYSTVNLAITSGTGTSGAALSGCTQTENKGVVTFSGCSINTAGSNYTLTATDTDQGVGLTSGQSSPFSVAVGPAAQLAFTTSPTGGAALSTISPQPVVAIEDAGGNTVTGATASVSLGITSGTGSAGATLSGCTSTQASGVIRFAACTINQTGTGYSLTATPNPGGLTPATSSSFNVGPAAARLAFTPSLSSSGVGLLSPQPVVTVQTAAGNPVTTDSSSVALTVSGPGALTGCVRGTESNGVTPFTGCTITAAGTYTITATDTTEPALTPAQSNLTVNPGAPASLAFTTQPTGNTISGSTVNAFVTNPAVSVFDSYGNVVTTDHSTVTLTIGTNPGGGTLSSCAQSENVGVITVTGCKISRTGSGYTLKATDGSLSVVSSPFNVTGPVSQLLFTTQPSGATTSSPFTSNPVVTVRDSSGNAVTADSSAMMLAIQANPGQGVLSGCAQSSETGGVFTFSACSINAQGRGYTLTATDAADGFNTPGTFVSSSFNIVGPASQLVFTTQPSGNIAGSNFATNPVVTIEDASGNPISTDSSTVSLTLQAATGPGGGGTLSGCAQTVESGGVAAFSACKVSTKGVGYSLRATDGSLAPALSASFNVTSTASQLVFTAQPSGNITGSTFATNPVVTIEDSTGYAVTADSSTVTLTLRAATGPGGGGSLSGCAQTGEAGGVFAFTACQVSSTGVGYSLKAADGALSVVSNPFNVSRAASKLVFTTQPGNGTTANLQTNPQVTIEDSNGYAVTADSSTVTLTIYSNPVTPPGSLSGCGQMGESGGVFTFNPCSISAAGNGYTLTATDGSDGFNTPGTFVSTAFTVTGVPSRLVLTASPPGTIHVNNTFGFAVTVEDSAGNPVTTDSSALTFAYANPTGGSMAGCTATETSGVFAVTGCKASKTGGSGNTGKGSYTITVTDAADNNLTLAVPVTVS
jgi:trimeric autotransporter adhesin